jgi:hypothetical protein
VPADDRRWRQREAPADNGSQRQQEVVAPMIGRGKSPALSRQETVAQQEEEAAQQEAMQQPADRANKRQTRGGGTGGQEAAV